MTYAADTDKRTHRVGYYLAFEGIATRLATHDFNALFGLSGTYAPCITNESLSGGETALDREHHIITGGGFSVRVMDTAAVRALFVRQRGEPAILASALTPSSTTLTLKSGTDSLANGSTVYIDRETLTLGTHSGSGVYPITRAVNGSVASAHGAGRVIGTSPRHWLTRVATLHQVYLDTGTEAALLTGVLGASPTFTDGAWDLQFASLLENLLNRPLLSGFQAVETDSVAIDNVFYAPTNSLEDVLVFTLPDGQHVNFVEPGYLRVEHDGKYLIFRAIEVDDIASTVTVPFRGRIGGNYDAPFSELVVAGRVTLQQIDFVRARVGHAALQVMLSDLGDEAVHPSDVLPGRAPSGTDELFVRRRTGAGLPASYVDDGSGIPATSWYGIPGEKIIFPIDESVKLGDFLTQEVLWRAGGYLLLRNGKLSFQPYVASTVRGALVTLGADDWLSGGASSADDEEGVIGRVVIECNYDPDSRRFTRREEIVWSDDGPVYGERAASITLSSKSLWIGSPQAPLWGIPKIMQGTETPLELQMRFDRARARYALGGRRFKRRFPWMYSIEMVEGYRFNLGDPYGVDHEGALGFSAIPVEVVERSPDFLSGDIAVTLEEIQTGVLLGSSAVVRSIASSRFVSLEPPGTASALARDDNDGGKDFAAGFKVRVYDASASPPFSVSEVEEVASVFAGGVELVAAPGSFTLAIGDLVVIEDSADSGNTNAYGADVHDYAFAADADLLVGTGEAYEREAARWA